MTDLSSDVKHAARGMVDCVAPGVISDKKARSIPPSKPSIDTASPLAQQANICFPLLLNSRLVHSDLLSAYARSGVTEPASFLSMSSLAMT